MINIILIIYTVWAIYSGYKVVTGRSVWLDGTGVLNIICKAIISVAVGYVYGAIYLLVIIIKFLGTMCRL